MGRGLHAEDVAVAAHPHLPPLVQRCFPALEPLDDENREAMKAALELKLAREVRSAQAQGLVPPPQQLAALPVFQRAQQLDADVLLAMEEEAARREAAARSTAAEARLAEEQRQRQAAAAHEAATARRLQYKEARRQERLAEKRDAAAKARAEELRRYEELYRRWEATVAKRQTALDEAQRGAAAAEEKAEGLRQRLEQLSGRREQLVGQLRDLADRPSEAKEAKPQQAAVVPTAHPLRSPPSSSFGRAPPPEQHRPLGSPPGSHHMQPPPHQPLKQEEQYGKQYQSSWDAFNLYGDVASASGSFSDLRQPPPQQAQHALPDAGASRDAWLPRSDSNNNWSARSARDRLPEGPLHHAPSHRERASDGVPTQHLPPQHSGHPRSHGAGEHRHEHSTGAGYRPGAARRPPPVQQGGVQGDLPPTQRSGGRGWVPRGRGRGLSFEERQRLRQQQQQQQQQQQGYGQEGGGRPWGPR